MVKKLPRGAVFILDNAKYHTTITAKSKLPKTTWSKPEIEAGLKERKLMPVDGKRKKNGEIMPPSKVRLLEAVSAGGQDQEFARGARGGGGRSEAPTRRNSDVHSRCIL